MTTEEKLVKVAENREKLYDAGKQAEHEEWWDKYLSHPDWIYRFGGRAWNDETFCPTKNLHPTGWAPMLFGCCCITDLVGILEKCSVTLDTSGLVSRCDSMFLDSYFVTRVPYIDMSNVTYSSGADKTFYNCRELETVIGLRVNDAGTTSLVNAFYDCTKLKNIVIDGVVGVDFDIRYSPLTRASMESIVSALSDTVTGKKVWFKKTAKTAAFTDAEWSALIGTKPNWTFTLV